MQQKHKNLLASAFVVMAGPPEDESALTAFAQVALNEFDEPICDRVWSSERAILPKLYSRDWDSEIIEVTELLLLPATERLQRITNPGSMSDTAFVVAVRRILQDHVISINPKSTLYKFGQGLGYAFNNRYNRVRELTQYCHEGPFGNLVVKCPYMVG